VSTLYQLNGQNFEGEPKAAFGELFLYARDLPLGDYKVWQEWKLTFILHVEKELLFFLNAHTGLIEGIEPK